MKRCDYAFKLGDRMLLSSKDINIEDHTPKLRLKYQGPWPIIKVISPVAYKLQVTSYKLERRINGASGAQVRTKAFSQTCMYKRGNSNLTLLKEAT